MKIAQMLTVREIVRRRAAWEAEAGNLSKEVRLSPRDAAWLSAVMRAMFQEQPEAAARAQVGLRMGEWVADKKVPDGEVRFS